MKILLKSEGKYAEVIKSILDSEGIEYDEEIQEISYDYMLYFMAPNALRVDHTVECIDYSNKKPDKLILFLSNIIGDTIPLEAHIANSLSVIGNTVVNNGGKWFKKLEDLIDFLKEKNKEIEEALKYTE